MLHAMSLSTLILALGLSITPSLMQESFGQSAREGNVDMILHNGKIVTVDPGFSIQQAIAIQGNRILQVGADEAVLKRRTDSTKVIDLKGKMVLPGLIESHSHPMWACMTEFDHPIPDMETIQDVLDYIKSRTQAVKEGEWIALKQVFITRLKEQRYPTKAELDAAAPRNPVMYSTGPDAMLNTQALNRCGIDKDYKITDGGTGFVEKDPKTGEPTGILRSCTRIVKIPQMGKVPTEKDQRDRLKELFRDYNSVGVTGVCDRKVGPEEIARYKALRDGGELSVRVALSFYFDGPRTGQPDSVAKIQQGIREVASDPLCKGDAMLRIIGVKMFLDGGMLTGSAYMRQPWGVSKMYGITDPDYRGVSFITKENLLPLVRTAIESGLQFTAHSVGDGAVHELMEVYQEINRTTPIRETHPCISHSNFMSKEAVEGLAKIGVAEDVQPAWLYLDTRTLVAQFGLERMRYFQPLHSIFEAGGIAGGGSDLMLKIGSLRSINPYNPFLGMWVTVTRKAKWYDGALHPEEALTREQAIRFYTMNNAWILRSDKEVGSLEAGKLADLTIVDRDILTCPEDEIKNTKALQTYLDGKLVFEANPAS